jgi:hypothetical protein
MTIKKNAILDSRAIALTAGAWVLAVEDNG